MKILTNAPGQKGPSAKEVQHQMSIIQSRINELRDVEQRLSTYDEVRASRQSIEHAKKQKNGQAWKSYSYEIDNNAKHSRAQGPQPHSRKCVVKQLNNQKEIDEFKNQHENAVLISNGRIQMKNGKQTMAMAQCMGQAILDGNLKRKIFDDTDSYFVVNQVKIDGKTQNAVAKFLEKGEAMEAYENAPNEPAKILVQGTTG